MEEKILSLDEWAGDLTSRADSDALWSDLWEKNDVKIRQLEEDPRRFARAAALLGTPFFVWKLVGIEEAVSC